MKPLEVLAKRLPLVLTLMAFGAGFGAGFWVYFHPFMERTVPPTGKNTPGSSLANVTLTEFDNNGNLIWEIKAGQAEYREDNYTAQILTVSGQFYRQGKVLIKATGKAGSVNQKQREIRVEGNVKAVLLAENIQIIADRMVWKADEDLLTATGNIRIIQPDRKITLVGKALRANPSTNRLTIENQVVVTTTDPPIQLEAPTLTWEAAQAIVRIDVPFRAFHKTEDLTVDAQKGIWNVKTQIINLTQEVIVKAPKRDWQVISRQLDWSINQNMLVFPQLLEIKSPSRGYVVRSQKGNVDLKSQVVRLQGSIEATSSTNQSVLVAEEAIWNIPAQQVDAQGNVIYRQAKQNLDVKGNRAVANLRDQTVQVSSTNTERVESLVIPE